MSLHINVIPAYGRDYKNQAQVREDWNDNKDFERTSIFHTGKYINKQDVENEKLFAFPPVIYVRYYKLRKVMKI